MPHCLQSGAASSCRFSVCLLSQRLTEFPTRRLHSDFLKRTSFYLILFPLFPLFSSTYTHLPAESLHHTYIPLHSHLTFMRLFSGFTHYPNHSLSLLLCPKVLIVNTRKINSYIRMQKTTCYFYLTLPGLLLLVIFHFYRYLQNFTVFIFFIAT